MSGMSSGFLLDSKNSSSLVGKPTYLTVSEYYGDKNQIHSELEKEQEILNQQHKSYRDQQEKTMNLLTNQLQQKFDLIEKKLAAQMANNETKAIAALEKKNQELENKYNTIQGKLTAKEHMYNEIAENNTKLQEAIATQEKKTANLQHDLLTVQTKCEAEINIAVNKTLALGQKITQLEQLQGIKQLQTLQTLQGQVQTFDSRINLLTSHEQARNQDFLALYNLTTSSRHELEYNMNNQLQTIQKNQNKTVAMLEEKQNQHFQILRNLTFESRNENEKLANHTMKEIEQMGRYHNSSFSLFQQNLDKQLQKVVVTGCTSGGGTVPAGPLKFPDIKTSVGVSNLSSFQSTGKFTCQVPGYYHIVTTIMSTNNNARIDIMKNSNSIHWQFVTGYAQSYWTPGTAAVALELKTNDTVLHRSKITLNKLHNSKITIDKLHASWISWIYFHHKKIANLYCRIYKFENIHKYNDTLKTKKNQRTRQDKVITLLDILPRRGPRAFRKFIDVLETDYNWIKERLEDELQAQEYQKRILDAIDDRMKQNGEFIRDKDYIDKIVRETILPFLLQELRTSPSSSPSNKIDQPLKDVITNHLIPLLGGSSAKNKLEANQEVLMEKAIEIIDQLRKKRRMIEVKTEITLLRKENKKSKKAEEKLTTENQKLKSDNTTLKADVKKLKSDSQGSRSELKKLKDEVQKYKTESIKLKQEKNTLKEALNDAGVDLLISSDFCGS
ncbi:unnamed protein product [Mytilus edulis]|uniref:CARD domain-containing protein n=1 Tax=Mytilus edulis TaxID=6550 RepID=A0A8S3QBN8_MYTED|nr:unnamed protein product [Mytilus edulis]